MRAGKETLPSAQETTRAAAHQQMNENSAGQGVSLEYEILFT